MVLQQEAEQPRDVAQGKVPRAVGNWCQALEGGLQQSPRELASLLCEGGRKVEKQLVESQRMARKGSYRPKALAMVVAHECYRYLG